MEHSAVITHVTVGGDGDMAVTASADGMCSVWNLEEGCLVTHLIDSKDPADEETTAHRGAVCSTFIDHDYDEESKVVITVGKTDRAVKVWQLQEKSTELIQTIEVEPD